MLILTHGFRLSPLTAWGFVMRQNTIDTRLCGRGKLPQQSNIVRKRERNQIPLSLSLWSKFLYRDFTNPDLFAVR